MKFAVSFFTALVIAVGALLFMQYQVYSEQASETSEVFTYSQEIEVTYRGGSLDVRHHFKNLPSGEVDIVWPAAAVDRQCFLETENSCARLSEDKTSFTAAERQAQSISYVIPIEGGLTSPKLLKGVFAQLQNGDVGFSTVHISTDSKLNGQWVTGVPMIGQQTLSLVNYTMFSGQGAVKDLFWQTGTLALQKKTESVSVYANQALTKEVSHVIDKLAELSEGHIAVIQGSSNIEGHRMLFLSDLSVETVQKEVLMSQIEAMYEFGETPLWMKQIVAMAIAGETFGTPRAQEAAAQLDALFDEEMRKDWVARIKGLNGQKITSQLLDKQLSAVVGNYTEYFSMNADAKQTYPFFVHDRRAVYVNGTENEAIDVVLHEGQILYTADVLLQQLGYTTSVGPNGYYVTGAERVFRFPEEKHGFYVFNNRRYNTTSSPFKIISGTYFIEESWMQRLFAVELTKEDEYIQITTTAQQ